MPEQVYLLLLIAGFGYSSIVAGILLYRLKIMPALGIIMIVVGVIYEGFCVFLAFQLYKSLHALG